MRLRSKSDFQRSRKDGKAFPGKFLVLSVLADAALGGDEGERFRFGIIVTRKVGSAVVRNRVRRRLRSLLSRYGARIAPGHQLVIVARVTAPTASFEDLERDWLTQLRRAGILLEEGGAG